MTHIIAVRRALSSSTRIPFPQGRVFLRQTAGRAGSNTLGKIHGSRPASKAWASDPAFQAEAARGGAASLQERSGSLAGAAVRGDAGRDAELKVALAKELPNFMQPQAIHWRETLPVNPNGKLDRTLISQQIMAEIRA